MARTVDEIYESIFVRGMPAPEQAWTEFAVETTLYNRGGEISVFVTEKTGADPEEVDPDIDLVDDFMELREIMNEEGGNPWNKAVFTGRRDGSFDLEFEYDEELAARLRD